MGHEQHLGENGIYIGHQDSGCPGLRGAEYSVVGTILASHLDAGSSVDIFKA